MSSRLSSEHIEPERSLELISAIQQKYVATLPSSDLLDLGNSEHTSMGINQ